MELRYAGVLGYRTVFHVSTLVPANKMSLAEFQEWMGTMDRQAKPTHRDTAALYWIGGAPCAGKSSVSRELASRHGLAVCSADDQWEEHTRRVGRTRQPLLASCVKPDWDNLFVKTPVERQVELEFAVYREQ